MFMKRFSAVAIAILLTMTVAAPSFAAAPTDDVMDVRATLPTIRNQGTDDVSYAFATMAAAELAVKNATSDTVSLSPQYMRYAMSSNGGNTAGFSQAYNAALSLSSNRRAAIAAFLMRGNMGGLALESTDPYKASSGVRTASLTSAVTTPYRIADVHYLPDVPLFKSTDLAEREKSVDMIKEYVAEYGAVTGFIALNKTTTTNPQLSGYWNGKEMTSYSYKSDNANANASLSLAISIVGWDDNYDFSDYSENLNNKPTQPGAFIVRTAWGDTFSEDGYFYLSYQDRYLCQQGFALSGAFNTNTEKFDYTYEHDVFGASSTIAYSASTVTAANVYTVTKANQEGHAISFAVAQPNTSYRLFVAPVTTTITDALSNLPAAVGGGVAEDAGYYTVKIPTTSLGAAGTKFVVAVEMTAAGAVSVPTEITATGFVASVKAEQSYTSKDAISWSDISATAASNACIKLLVTQTDLQRPTRIELNKTSFDDMTIGETAQLLATPYVAALAVPDAEITWSSSDATIATVNSSGAVRFLKAGSCQIIATAKLGGATEICSVTVKPNPVESITLNKTTLDIKTNQTVTLVATVTANASDKTLIWTTSDETLASVTSLGVVKGMKPTDVPVIITATSKSDPSVFATCSVTVKADYLTGIKLSAAGVSLGLGSVYPLKITTTPSTAYVSDLVWTSEAEEVLDGSAGPVAIFENGQIKALKPGKVTLVATAVDKAPTAEKFATAKIVVTVSSKADVYVDSGKYTTLTSGIEGANSKDLVWKVFKLSDVVSMTVDDMIATESTTAVGFVPTTNRAKLTMSTIGEYRVLVYDATDASRFQIFHVFGKSPIKKVFVNLQGDATLKLRKTELTLNQDNTNPTSCTLVSKVEPADATYTDVKWVSSKPAVATVDQAGVVTTVAPGSATIYAIAESDKKQATFSVSVKYNTNVLTLNKLTPQNVAVKRSLSVKATIDKVKNISKVMTWTSSDPAVATVTKTGSVKVLATGTTTITCTAAGGKTASVVVNGVIPVTKITVGSKRLILKAGQSTASGAAAYPDTATVRTLTYSSKNPGIASVDASGNITAVAVGSTSIYVVSENGKKVSITVKVTE